MSHWIAAVKRMEAEGIEVALGRLVQEMTQWDRLECLSGPSPDFSRTLEDLRHYNATPIIAGNNLRLGIPGIRFSDGPRGVVMGRSTAFPVSMARGATFDPELEARVGDIIGVEARTQGANFYGGVCINLLRHPGWGRAQETYGEDSHLLGEMGASLVRGVQRHLMACAKHYALNSMENSRFIVDVRVDEQTLDDIYLPHFRRCVDAGVAGIMSAYNKVNGEWCGHHSRLLRTILKEKWRFEGFVMSDFVFGVRDGVAALKGGLDIEMPVKWRFRSLPKALKKGRLSWATVDEALRRILRQQLRFARVGEPKRYHAGAVACREHRLVAREVAEKATVLLQNNPLSSDESPLLPFTSELGRLAVIGRLSDFANTGDRGSSWVRAPDVITIAGGLREAGERRGITVDVVGSDSLRRGVEAARHADAVVLVVGNTYREEGEYLFVRGGDRRQLGLSSKQTELVRQVSAINPKIVVVLVGGAPILCEEWRRRIPAIMMAWYPGMEGGRAIANILFGDAEAGGRLPCTWPARPEQLPAFRRWTRRITYGPLHGYRAFIADRQNPSWWFGHGLGYTSFEIRSAVRSGNSATIELANTGSRDGEEVVQIYVEAALGSHPRPLPALCGFRRTRLSAGQVTTLQIPLEPWLLDRAATRGKVVLWVGQSADPTRMIAVQEA